MGARRGVLRLVLAFAALALAPSVVGNAAAQARGPRPWLGIVMDVDMAAPGVRVGHVVRGSPADKAGLREGDHIVRVAALPVSLGPEVVHEIATRAAGDSVEIAFVREGKDEKAIVVLAPMPPQDDMIRMDLVGAAAPPWKDLAIVSGSSPTSVASLRGHVVLLDFWATWCLPCRVFVPKLGALQARYGAQGLSVLGVSTERAPDVALFAQRMAMRYAVAVDKHAETTRSYGVVSMPTLVVVDKRGVVRDVSVGYDPSDDARLEATVRTLLAEVVN